MLKEASCACGALCISMNGPPVVVSSCCCHACQRRSGSLVSVQAFYNVDQVGTVSGASQAFERIGDSGMKVTYHFCPACGTTLYWMPEFRPGKIAVAVGAFADQNFPRPERLVWTNYRHPWVQVPEGTREYPGNAPYGAQDNNRL